MIKHGLKFMGVFALVIVTTFAPLSQAQTALAASNTTNQVSAVTDTFTYVVQSGDTLSGIAQTYNTSVAAIMALNPQITDPNYIYVGEQLLIPVGAGVSTVIPLTGPAVVVSPGAISLGGYAEVSVSDFPANTSVVVNLHPLSSTQVEVTQDGTTDVNGALGISLQLPASVAAYSNQAWQAQVYTTSGISLNAVSNTFELVSGVATSSSSFTYIVQPGDTLSSLAAAYHTTESAILALNPQLAGSLSLYNGEVLSLPLSGTLVQPVIPLTGLPASTEPVAQILPTSGTQGAYIQVSGAGFPAFTSVQIGLHKLNRKLIESSATATTDAYGQVTIVMRIPKGSSIANNRVWLAEVTTTDGSSVSATSNPFYVTGNGKNG